MKRVGKFCICLAGGLVLNAGLRAEDAVSPDDPYALIVTRNVFGINPPTLGSEESQKKAESLPKITPNGITSVFGHQQVLFKVAVPARPGQPGKDQSYILSVGEAQDEIEVTKIDEKNSIVTFNNHGEVQELPLANAAAGGSSAPAPSGPAPGPAFPRPGFFPGGGNFNNGGPSRFGQSGNNAKNSGMNGGANPGSRLGVGVGGGGSYPSPQSNPEPRSYTADEQQVLVTANHAVAVAQGDPTAILYPPSKYDPDAGVASPSAPGGSAPP